MSRINTNMASEFWFFSQLHRLGYKAFITLGNTKAIDITVQLSDSTILTFDVKGKQTFNSGTYQYLPNTCKENHYFCFVGLQIKNEGKIIKFEGEPECYIISSKDLDLFAFNWTARNKISVGYGFDQNIFRIIKKYSSENEIKSKTEQRKFTLFKKNHNITNLDFLSLRDKIMRLEDFEIKYHDKK